MFFESVKTKDDTFSQMRAERIDWIRAALEDPKSERYVGWDKKRKRLDRRRRVTLVMGNYVVVIGISTIFYEGTCVVGVGTTPPAIGSRTRSPGFVK